MVLLKVGLAQAQEGSIPIDPYLNAIEDSFVSNLPGLNLIDTEDFNNTPVYATRKVASYLRYFATDGRDTFQKWLDQSGPYLFHIKEILREDGRPQSTSRISIMNLGHGLSLWHLITQEAAR